MAALTTHMIASFVLLNRCLAARAKLGDLLLSRFGRSFLLLLRTAIYPVIIFFACISIVPEDFVVQACLVMTSMADEKRAIGFGVDLAGGALSIEAAMEVWHDR